jgi:hypothetical protein
MREIIEQWAGLLERVDALKLKASAPADIAILTAAQITIIGGLDMLAQFKEVLDDCQLSFIELNEAISNVEKKNLMHN